MAEREVGNGFKPFRSAEAVGRGSRTRRFSFRTVRGTVPTTGNSPYNGEQSLHVPTTENSPYNIHFIRKFVKPVGNGFQPFRRAEEQPPPAPPPAGDKSVVAAGRGPRTRRFPFRTVRGTVPTTENSPYNVEQSLQYPIPPQACKACRERVMGNQKTDLR
jgi:hypothetical protein